ncbi:MAG: hypothetical protein IH984_12060 [Planctomycetes bacterium]|nr:hypothetical protein [Planctomycetota bacterium]
MFGDRMIQFIALVIAIISITVCGSLLPKLVDISEEHTLHYTDIAVESAPPFVVLGSMIGAVRGIIVDYLWIKVNLMKQKGLFYDVMADADMITKLQPRFAAVWAFHGHNMAYNISVIHNTAAERWEWVMAGINLVRNKGLRYNPNDLQLHRELSFWFSHKIEGVADDAHFYYKKELCKEWHYLLGQPPAGHEDRIAWIKEIADAAESLEAAEARTSGIKALVERLRSQLSPYDQRFTFSLDRKLLRVYGEWISINEQSAVALIKGTKERRLRDDLFFKIFDEIAKDPDAHDAWKTLLAHIRKRVLVDEYNMDPQLMYEYTRDYGPIDWRHGSAHALYWALKGAEQGGSRVISEADAYSVVNNDRAQIQAMQDLARWGRINFDPFSNDIPGRYPEPAWIGVIDKYWETLSIKHKETRGPGVDLFMDFHKNFLSSAVRELYRSGETVLAQQFMDRLKSLYGRGQFGDPKFSLPMREFAAQETQEQYDMQPFLAPSEVAAALRYAVLYGWGRNRPEIFKEAKRFADDVLEFYTTTNYNKFVTKMGTARLADLIGTLEGTLVAVCQQVMTDPTIGFFDRMVIYNRMPAEYQIQIYDAIYPSIVRDLQNSDVTAQVSIDVALPIPPGIQAYRQQKAQEEKEKGQIKTQDSQKERK